MSRRIDNGGRRVIVWQGGSFVFPVFDPRFTDLVLGLTIGLSVAAAWHWVAWTIH